MPEVVSIGIDASQFPENVALARCESLRTRQINHKFLYESYKQSQKWLAVHQAHSPWKSDLNLAATYDAAFVAAARRVSAPHVHVIGLGCGDGQKDARLLHMLGAAAKGVSYLPVDVSMPLVLMAHQAACEVLAPRNARLETRNVSGLVCDLASADDLSITFNQQTPPAAIRLLTFFGLIPNFEPQLILPKLRALVRPNDLLLLSANLAPGHDYEAGVRRILPQYDNAPTRDWLLTFLFDLGVENRDGDIQWSVETSDTRDLLRVTASFRFTQRRVLRFGEETFAFAAGETIRLFFSYRYTPDRVRTVLATHGLAVEDQWIADSEEEGVFLCTPRNSVADD